ncbi:MAG: glucose-1-phosphate adenylyltransferase [Sporomusaceae bacterium]|nr:glucose-1-phosphate adenylyltransferase [Sporomusaceae bacterium]
MRQECVAMILAGGQGSRLGVLTKRLAKPAVPFGGKYRIIDFPLSNCSNSGIYTVGVLTQYQPLDLHTYIGIGSAWDLDRMGGGVYVLPPFVGQKGGQWYKGTANAIYQNTEFVDTFDPDYVLILSGDHIYKMDYSLMLEFHKEKQADATIAVFEVPWEEASRFGIMNTDAAMRIVEFNEKPKQPKSNLASMGVYIFNWSVLKSYLEADARDPASEYDFGKNVIPAMLNAGLGMYAYPFQGYWKDVGTVESLWEANMDLLTEQPELDLHDSNWRIYSVNPSLPPHYISAAASVSSSMVSEGCVIEGEVENSILFPGVTVAAGAVVRHSILFPDARVGAGAIVEKAIIGSRTAIEAGGSVGCGVAAGDGVAVVGDDIIIPAGTPIPCRAMVEA